MSVSNAEAPAFTTTEPRAFSTTEPRAFSTTEPRAFTTTHRLRFNDTDKLGHINNGVFAVMLEQGRAELMDLAGLPVGGSDQAVVIVRMELDYLAEMTWPGDVGIATEVARLGTRSFNLRQRLTFNDKLCGQSTTVLVVMDRAAKKAVPIDPWRETLTRWLVAEP